MTAKVPKAPKRTRKPRKLTATTPEAPMLAPRPTFDTESGTVNIWPIVAAGADQLAAEIAAGDHDGYLSLLGHVDRSQNDEGRAKVQEAVRKRLG